MPFITERWLKKVAETSESDLRGHRTTLTYYRIARELDEFLLDDDSVWACINARKPVRICNANWFNFATWATVTINKDIRHKRPPVRSERVLPGSLRQWLSPVLLNIEAGDGQRISRALSWGQRLVFLCTTFAFVRMRERPDLEFYDPANPSKVPEWFEDVADLATWNEKPALSPSRHLTVVERAFELYRLAKLAYQLPNDSNSAPSFGEVVAARLIFMANVLLTAVEQDVVDDAVHQVIDHVPRLASASASGKVARWAETYFGYPRQLVALNLPYRYKHQRDAFTSAWARFMTDQILVMTLPAETLRLGRDIPPLRASQPYYPAELDDVSNLPDKLWRDDEDESKMQQHLRDLYPLVRAFDRTRGDGAGSAAWDWRRYDERMNWALTLIRSRQQDPTLFWAPYTGEDETAIRYGRRPRDIPDPSSAEVLAPLSGSEVWPE